MLANPEAKNSKGSQSSPGEDGLQPAGYVAKVRTDMSQSSPGEDGLQRP